MMRSRSSRKAASGTFASAAIRSGYRRTVQSRDAAYAGSEMRSASASGVAERTETQSGSPTHPPHSSAWTASARSTSGSSPASASTATRWAVSGSYGASVNQRATLKSGKRSAPPGSGATAAYPERTARREAGRPRRGPKGTAVTRAASGPFHG